MHQIAAPLPAPFLSTHRRTRSTIQQTQNTSIKTASQAPTTPDRRSLSTTATLNTPPPKANILDKLKAKGIATEPPQPRRRPVRAFNPRSDGHVLTYDLIRLQPNSSTSAKMTTALTLTPSLERSLPFAQHPSTIPSMSLLPPSRSPLLPSSKTIASTLRTLTSR